ncbi:thermonuclease family protein [Stappia sp. TSB10GB4]|uniref:thermonuclease family protein n=1 Tax=Stappia sp. TSB10GB4 TaxID=2003584 RepID=UPI0016448924|nr:thermonuclease family protein [Stappia sp. TSB10GB4]
MGRTFLIAVLIAGVLAIAADYGSGGLVRAVLTGMPPGEPAQVQAQTQAPDMHAEADAAERPVAGEQPAPAVAQAQADDRTAPTSPSPSPAPAPILPDAPDPTSIRNVTPSDILPPPQVSGPLKRVAPQLPKLPEREIPSEITFHQPLVLDAGSFRAKHLTIRLAGIDAPGPEETCPSRLGGTWPCGMRARTALRGLVLRHAVTCEDMQDTPAGVVLARCRRQGTDLAAWLVAQGWARPGEGAGEELFAAAAAAREARRGIWQLDGPALPPGSSLPALPLPALPLPGELPDPLRPAPQQPGRDADGTQVLPLDLPPVEITDTPWHPGNAR